MHILSRRNKKTCLDSLGHTIYYRCLNKNIIDGAIRKYSFVYCIRTGLIARPEAFYQIALWIYS